MVLFIIPWRCSHLCRLRHLVLWGKITILKDLGPASLVYVAFCHVTALIILGLEKLSLTRTPLSYTFLMKLNVRELVGLFVILISMGFAIILLEF